jgi:cell division protein FtsB
MVDAMRLLWAVIAVAVALSGLLGYRVVRLEQRVGALSRQLGAQGASAAAGEQRNYEQRLSALEREARALRDDLETLEKATGERPAVAAIDTAANAQQILSVVGREQERIRDRQLQFHRARWLEWRESALDNFAQAHRLSPVQTEQLHQLLAAEVEALVEILRRPDVAENPERASNDWLDRLELTDRAAHNILDAAQVGPWDTARAIERRVFWPWLPPE